MRFRVQTGPLPLVVIQEREHLAQPQLQSWNERFLHVLCGLPQRTQRLSAFLPPQTDTRETFLPSTTPIWQPGYFVLKGKTMTSTIRIAAFLVASLLGATACNAKAGPTAAVPAPLQDEPRAATAGHQTAVISGGC